MSAPTLDPPRAWPTDLDDPANDEGGVCHRLVNRIVVCGAPVASDSPGLHGGDTDMNGNCTGCGRPRCPDCARIFGEL